MSDVQKTKLFGARAAYVVGAAHENGWALVPYIGAAIATCVMVVSHDVSQVEPVVYPTDDVKTAYSDDMYNELSSRVAAMADVNGTIKSLEVDILRAGLDENAEEVIAALEAQKGEEQEKLDAALTRFYTTLYASPDITETQFSDLKEDLIESDLSIVKEDGGHIVFDISDDSPEVFRECQANVDFNDGDRTITDSNRVENCMNYQDNMSSRKTEAGLLGFLKGAFASAIVLGGLGAGLNSTAGNYYRRRRHNGGLPKASEFTRKQN